MLILLCSPKTILIKTSRIMLKIPVHCGSDKLTCKITASIHLSFRFNNYQEVVCLFQAAFFVLLSFSFSLFFFYLLVRSLSLYPTLLGNSSLPNDRACPRSLGAPRARFLSSTPSNLAFQNIERRLPRAQGPVSTAWKVRSDLWDNFHGLSEKFPLRCSKSARKLTLAGMGLGVGAGSKACTFYSGKSLSIFPQPYIIFIFMFRPPAPHPFIALSVLLLPLLLPLPLLLGL